MRNVFIVLGIMAILVIGWMLWISTPDSTPLPEVSGQGQQVIVEEEAVSLVGKTICLSHKNMEPPHDDVCRFGFVTADGLNYALDTTNMENGLPEDFDKQDDVRITGTLTSFPDDNRYDVVALIKATYIEPSSASAEDADAEEQASEDEEVSEVIEETEDAATEEE